MTIRTMPGFTAESSLGPATGIYRGTAVHSGIGGNLAANIEPQQLFGFGNLFFDCFGTPEQCQADNCAFVPSGPLKAQCFAACRNPSVCSGCRCTCNANCARTCIRSCIRQTTSGNYILKCNRPCFPDVLDSLSGIELTQNPSIV